MMQQAARRAMSLVLAMSGSSLALSQPASPAPALASIWDVVAQPTNELRTAQWRPSPGAARLALPTPAANVVAAWLVQGQRRSPLFWTFNAEATRLDLDLTAAAGATTGDEPPNVLLETADETRQFPDGRIVFAAQDAVVHGAGIQRESNPGNVRLGFWTDPDDWVSWSFKPTRWGAYQAEVAYSAEGGEGTELEFVVAGQEFSLARPATGSWFRYTTLPLGRVYIGKAEPFTVRIGCRRLRGAAVMNLKALMLRPAAEGKPIAQQADGTIVLHARDAIIHGTMMRYEPATNKNCLGYWVNPRDWAEWEFSVANAGRFAVELWQGCGTGQGGSEVTVQSGMDLLTFRVEETGHFQKFVPRRIGMVNLTKAGAHSLAVRPVRRQAAAVMDVQQIRLVPAPAAKE